MYIGMQFERLCIHRPARRTPRIENAPRAEQNAPHPEPRGAFGINISVISHNCYRKRYHVSAAVTFFMPIMPKTRIFKDYYVI